MNFRDPFLHCGWQTSQSRSLCGPLIVVQNIHKMPRDSIIRIFWGLGNYIVCHDHTLSQYDSLVVHVHYPVIDSTSSFGQSYHFDKEMNLRVGESLSY